MLSGMAMVCGLNGKHCEVRWPTTMGRLWLVKGRAEWWLLISPAAVSHNTARATGTASA